jgi:ribosome-binding factor A
MKFPSRWRGDRRHPAAFSREVDPDLFFSDAPHAKPDHHTRALCKQVQRTLLTVLSGECADPLLQDLLVLAVLPAPNAGHLLVVVAPRSADITLVEALERLRKVTPLLRARIAQDTARKRTPDLSFNVLCKGLTSLEPPPVEDDDSAHEDFEKEDQP